MPHPFEGENLGHFGHRDEQMLQELARMAEGHVKRSGGMLELLEANTELYPAQAAYHLDGDPKPAAVVEALATIADPRFPQLLETLQLHEEETNEVSRIGELLKGGNNVLLATNHGDLIDIALVEAALYTILDKQQYQFQTGIVISKMVSMLAYRLGEDTAPAAEVLKILCNDVFLSFPRTETTKKSPLSRLLPDDIRRHNKHMRAAVEDKLHTGGMLLAVAASGTTDKPLPDDPDTYVLGTLGKGTAKLMMQPKTYVLPVAVWLKDEEPLIRICDIPRLVQTEAEAHDVMEKIRRTLGANTLGYNFEYHGASEEN